MERGTSFGVPPPIPGRGRPAPGFGRGVSLSAGLVIAVAVVIVLLPLWVWFFCRIEPGEDQIAILIRKTGRNLDSGQIDRVFLTGGSSFVPAVRAMFEARFDAAKIATGSELESIATGLSLIGGEADLGPWCSRAG